MGLATARTALKHPWTAVRVLKSKIVRPFVSGSDNRVNILEEDWDNLIILDACRFDSFKQHNTIEGELTKIHSSATHTAEFVEKNIKKKYPDIVYITASPQLVGSEGLFHHVEHLWNTCWSDEYRTVLPATVTQQTKEIAQSYPEKRLVVHYMQPHYPFIGEYGEQIGKHATFTGGGAETREYQSVWDQLTARKADPDMVKKAYEENLQIVLPHVEELVFELDGKTVVTSDHGNLFREKVTKLPIKIEGHPPNFPAPELTAIPWLECPYKARKEVTTAKSNNANSTVNANDVQERLEDLGYL